MDQYWFERYNIKDETCVRSDKFFIRQTMKQPSALAVTAGSIHVHMQRGLGVTPFLTNFYDPLSEKYGLLNLT